MIVESFDEGGGMMIGFEGEYTLTAEQMTKIAGALYLADCELNDRSTSKSILNNEQTPFSHYDNNYCRSINAF